MAVAPKIPWSSAVETLATQIVTLVIANAPTMSWPNTQNALRRADEQLRARSKTLSQVIPQVEPVDQPVP